MEDTIEHSRSEDGIAVRNTLRRPTATSSPTMVWSGPWENRPERFGERTAASEDFRKHIEGLIQAGMDPNEVAAKVMTGIRENELFIFSHPEWRGAVEEHLQRMMVAYPQR